VRARARVRARTKKHEWANDRGAIGEEAIGHPGGVGGFVGVGGIATFTVEGDVAYTEKKTK